MLLSEKLTIQKLNRAFLIQIALFLVLDVIYKQFQVHSSDF